MIRESSSESVLPSNAIDVANPYAIPLRLRGRAGVGAIEASTAKLEISKNTARALIDR
jgi:hypothetical protein